MEKPAEPLRLDPFAETGREAEDAENEAEVAGHADTATGSAEDYLSEPMADPAEEADCAEEQLYPMPEDAFEEPEETCDDVVEACTDPAGEPEGEETTVPLRAAAPAQSDEEIAACLGRALAAGTPEVPAARSLADAAPAPLGSAPGLSLGALAQTQPIMPPTAGTPAPTPEAPRENTDRMTTREIPTALPETDDLPLDLSAVAGPETASVTAGLAGRRAGRVKTRLLGFNRTGDAEHDPFGQAPEATATAQSEKYPVGWLVIVEGPGVGHSFSLFTGASMIGRGEDQVIRLDFGDNSISRHNHAAIAYDEEQNKFYIGHGGKSNIIRRNARPVLSTEELHHADLIRIGETTLRFVALCGSDFQWNRAGGAHGAGA
jgi:hypothetical protein